MDYETREAKAIEMLNAPDPPAAAPAPAAAGGSAEGSAVPGVAPGAAAAPGAGGVAQPAAVGKAGAPGVPGAPGAAAQPAAAADGVALWGGAQPVALNDLQQLMGSHNIASIDQLQGTLADAGALYNVLDGKQPASALFEAVRLNYSPQVFFRVLGEVRDYLQRFVPPPGFSGPGGPGANAGGPPPAGVGAGAGANGSGNGNGAGDPNLALRISQLENNWQGQQRQAQMQAQQEQMRNGFNAFMGRIRELGQKEDLDEEEIGNYAAAVAQRVNGDPNITGRLIQGKLSDIDRLFTEHHNSMLQWENRRNQKRLQQKTEKSDTQPRIATGGGPPAPGKPAKQDMSFEARTARALELLKQ